MRSVITLLAVIIAFSSCSKNGISGSGRTLTETRTVTSFNRVQLEGSGHVNIVQGTWQKVEVTGYENLLPIYETDVQNGTLVLKFKKDYYNIYNNNISINITLPVLLKTGINGSGTYTIKSFNGTDITTEINGSGNIYFENCTYNKAFLKVNGSGYTRAEKAQTAEAELEINGSGKIDISCLQKLKATIHGSGEINYWGSPAVTADISGSGTVRKK